MEKLPLHLRQHTWKHTYNHADTQTYMDLIFIYFIHFKAHESPINTHSVFIKHTLIPFPVLGIFS